jgi:mRNA-degrading endonuclease RelE of RelBE toxin-antitoxin system
MRVEFTSAFQRQLRRLARRYPHIRADLEPLIDQLRAGEIVGDQVPRVGHTLFKVRVANRDARRGTRGGYRIIYCLRSNTRIVLVTIYSKSDQGDVSAEALRRIVDELDG